MNESPIGLAQFRVWQRQRLAEALKARALTWEEAVDIADRIKVARGTVKLYYRQRLIFSALETEVEPLQQ